MHKSTTAYIGLGSNLGDKKSQIDKALKMLAQSRQTQIVRTSDLAETEPLGTLDQPRYLNGVVEVSTSLSAEELHKRMAEIETALGRQRGDKWLPRTIDLDLLLFGEAVVGTADLTVPHSQMHLRSFVLSGLCQLNGEIVHPVLNESMSVLAARLGGGDFALNPDRAQLVSIAGVIGVGKTTLAKRISESLGCKCVFEAYDENPFLAEVYAGRKELALDSQLYFLTSRNTQLNLRALTQGQIAVSDYIFDKELIYARRLLNPQQLALYEKTYQQSEGEVTAPVLVIYLLDSAQECLERIHKRNRPYEQVIDLQFLEKLGADYERLLGDWKLCPVIRLSTSKFDCTRNGDIEHLVNQIKSYVAA